MTDPGPNPDWTPAEGFVAVLVIALLVISGVAAVVAHHLNWAGGW